MPMICPALSALSALSARPHTLRPSAVPNPSLLRARRRAVAATLLLAGAAQADTLVGLTDDNRLARINSADTATASTRAIVGLDAGDRFIGIDRRPGDNRIYGITLSNRLYTVDEFSGATRLVASLSQAVIDPALAYGIDFNPMADFSGATSLRLVSSAGSNFAINANTGAVGNAASNIGAGFSAVAYSNSLPLPTAAPASTALYYINSDTDTLHMAPSAFNAPAISTAGSLGVDVGAVNGFEWVAGGRGFAALNVGGGNSLYQIDLASGAATALGPLAMNLTGLTVSAVPEPQTWALMAAGLLAVGGLARRRAQGV